MSSIGFIDFNINAAESFIKSINDSEEDRIYLTFGKIHAWANDSSPSIANTAPTTFSEIWKNMIGGKKVTGNDVSLGINRINWEANTIYTQYDQTNVNLYSTNSNFYVLTSDFNIYKCLFNNYNANSTIKPISINANNITQTGDGYIWKYMYTLDSSDRIKYTTSEYIPIKTLSNDNGSIQWDVQEAAEPGTIYASVITNSGNNYSNVSNTIITFSGDGSGATGTIGINNVSNTVNSITMLNYGVDYTYADVTISGGGGANAAARALISPMNGHGNNPTYELMGRYVILNMRLNNNEEFISENEFRQIALIKNPLKYNDTNVASNTVFSQHLSLTVVGDSFDYLNDEYIYQGSSLATATFKGKVLN
ncbi:MAG: hypothetical protein WD512_03840, partial [Candidatus Paceibacterota bacterium]